MKKSDLSVQVASQAALSKAQAHSAVDMPCSRRLPRRWRAMRAWSSPASAPSLPRRARPARAAIRTPARASPSRPPRRLHSSPARPFARRCARDRDDDVSSRWTPRCASRPRTGPPLAGLRRNARSVFGECIKDGNDLAQRSAKPGEFPHDKAIAALQGAHQLVESSALF